MASVRESTNMSSVTQSQSDASHLTSRHRRLKEDGNRKKEQLMQQLDSQRVIIFDPENKNKERTPLPLYKPPQSKSVIKKGLVDRRASQATQGDSVSHSRHSHSEDRSNTASHMESSTSSVENMSTDTPDDESTTFGVDDSSDSVSTPGDRSTSVADRNKSVMSSSDGASMADGNRGASQAAPSGPSNEKDLKEHDANRLPGYTRVPFKKNGEPVNQTKAKTGKMTEDEKRRWLHETVTITLTETPTIMGWSHQDEAVLRENQEEEKAVSKKNDRYRLFCEARAGGESGGKYQERGVTTTLNKPSRCAKCGTQPPQMVNSGGIQVTTWKLYDEMQIANEDEPEADDAGLAGAAAVEGEDEAVAGDDVAAGEDGEEGGEGEEGGGGDTGGAKKASKSQAWLNAASLLETVMVVERAVVSNVYEELQLAYRGISMEKLTDHLPPEKVEVSSPTSQPKRREHNLYSSPETDAEKQRAEEQKDKDEIEKPQRGKDKLEKLWCFGDSFTKGKNVSCMAWNRNNQDILAAGYGEYGVPGASANSQTSSRDAYKGFVNCWSLKNPVAPERTIKLESDAGVSALHFSNIHPSLLAVGNTDGTLALYDVRKHGNTPALRTSVNGGQHTGTIWEVKWVDKAKDRSGSENLVSISADGFVMEWSIKKGLEKTSAFLMKLKRQPKEEGASAFARNGGKEALLSRQSGGMAFDMNWEEPLTYVIGTEDGGVHKCTKSQAENFVLDYTPHAEPVYRVRWSPFNHEYFMTCSADWTSRLYHWDTPHYLQKFVDSSKQDAVHDICWSPRNCTMFGAATSQGVVDIWDIREPMQPNASLALKENKNVSLNCLLFAEQDSPLLTVGDSEGDVTVVKLNGSEFEGNGLDKEQQAERFHQVVQKVKL